MDKNVITVTEKAIQEIKRLHAKESDQNSVLRVSIVGGGCSGYSYKFQFESSGAPTDCVIDNDGLKIVVDQKSALFLNGAELDFSDGLNGTGFNFTNPNATRVCGCNSSFSV